MRRPKVRRRRGRSRSFLAFSYGRGRGAIGRLRPGVALLFILSLLLPPILFTDPIVLAGSLTAAVASAYLTGLRRELAMWLAMAAVISLAMIAINALVSREGATVVFVGPDLPWLGPVNITLEAIVFGFVLALRIVTAIVVFAIYALAVDPDRVTRLLGRLSLRSALTVSLTARLVPVLARDAVRLGDANRCRPPPAGPAASARGRRARIRERAPVVRALMVGSLDRAIDLAAALEVRGFGRAARRRSGREPWSWADRAFCCAAAVAISASVTARSLGVGTFEIFQSPGPVAGPAEVALAIALVALPVAPFLALVGRRRRLPGPRPAMRPHRAPPAGRAEVST